MRVSRVTLSGREIQRRESTGVLGKGMKIVNTVPNGRGSERAGKRGGEEDGVGKGEG